MNEVFQLLEQLNITYQRYDHPASVSCEDSAKYLPDNLPGLQLRHLFLRDRKKKQFFLFAYNAERKVCLKKLGIMLGVKGLTMASMEDMKSMLHVESGAVSLLAMMNDTEHKVTAVLDKELQTASHFCGVPNSLTSMLIIANEDWMRFFKHIGCEPVFVDAPPRETERVPGTPRRRTMTETEKEEMTKYSHILS
ncbi:Prolyl-tRNA editing protein ProX [invertebrate metagenome]|uniref:Prolyl-tRNA editing protein ProX n=1 Tax=invertebrate metagenome TaxID=1711999 RepID=A0A2H9TA85_9ZZZZ